MSLRAYAWGFVFSAVLWLLLAGLALLVRAAL